MSRVMRIKLTSNRDVYDCVSVGQQQQPQRALHHCSSSSSNSSRSRSSTSRIDKNNNENIHNGSVPAATSAIGSQTSTSLTSTSSYTAHRPAAETHTTTRSEPTSSLPQNESNLNQNNNNSNNNNQTRSPFEVISSSPLIRSAGGNGDSFLDDDDDSDEGGFDRQGERRGRRRNSHNGDDGHTISTNNTAAAAAAAAADRPSNETLLGTAFISFLSFSLIQLFFAFIAGSQAMKGDSAAMIVDSMTYLFNWIAEKKKYTFDETYIAPPLIRESPNNPAKEAKRIKKRAKRKMVLTLETCPPLISVSGLIGITIVVLKRAIHVLFMDFSHQTKKEDQTDPNIRLMFAFSTFNLGLDALNVFCFAKSKHLTGFQTMPDPHATADGSIDTADPTTIAEGAANTNNGDSNLPAPIKRTSGSYLEIDQTSGTTATHHHYSDGSHGRNGISSEEAESAQQPPPTPKSVDHTVACLSSSSDSLDDEGDKHAIDDNDDHVIDDDDSSHDDDEEANLNMCSAYTHVFADTLRSVAVIIAALVAFIVPDVTSEEADAAAAVVVSILILLSLIPLFQGLITSLKELWAIRAEEQSEQMFCDAALTHGRSRVAAATSSTNDLV